MTNSKIHLIFITSLAIFGLFFLGSFVLPSGKAIQRVPFSADSAAYFFSASPYYIIIDKSDYELKVYDKEGWYATYPVVFGSKDLSDKMREGDKRTPTGDFTIVVKKIHQKWSEELLLNYPTDDSFKKFQERKAKGLIPANARIGDGIAIHATRKEEEWTVDNFYNWTDGCISVKYSEMKDLYSYIPTGTKVTIKN